MALSFYFEQANFSVAASEQHLITFIVELSLRAKAVCFQIHRMKDGSITAFWNFSPDSKAVVALAECFIIENDLPTDIAFITLLDCTAFQEKLRSSFPAFEKKLSTDEINAVNSVLKARLEQDVAKTYGLDGHGYTLILYPEQESRQYNCWCAVPKEWNVLKPFILLLLSIADLDKECYGYM